MRVEKLRDLLLSTMRHTLKILFLMCLCMPVFTLTVYATEQENSGERGINENVGYDVNQPHIVINQIYGAGDGGYSTHSFIELYNSTDLEVNLSINKEEIRHLI